MATEFRKIEKGNDWGSSFYTYEGERLDETRTNDTQNALMLEAGQVVTVEWPDGKTTTERLCIRPERGSYHEQGQLMPTEYTDNLFGVMATAFGASVFVPLEQLKLPAGMMRRRDRKIPAQP